MSRELSRRDFLASGLVTVGAALAGPALWRQALAAPRVTEGPYGPLLGPDANGLRLPERFRSRAVARSGRAVQGYVWHDAPDGGTCFETDDDGWIYVSNSEVDDVGGVGALVFDSDGQVIDAYRICENTSRNCSGGPTPWGTWLTCEEFEGGQVWECDPKGREPQRAYPAMGRFRHEAAAVDPGGKHVYLTEDEPDGRFYRFVPDDYPSLERGTLQVAIVSTDGAVRWRDVPDPSAREERTRRQVPGSTRFDGGEGTWFDEGVVYFTTKGDDRVWAYDTAGERLSLLHDPATTASTPLRGVDNLTGSTSGDLYVAEDGGNLEIVVITPSDEIAPIVQVTGSAHDGSELCGPALTPDGRRLYFSSQRGFGRGITYEVTGPFRSGRIDRVTSEISDPLPLSEDDDGGITPAGIAGIAAATAGAAAAATAVRRRRRRADRSDA